MARLDKNEVKLLDEKVFKALQDALSSGAYVVTPQIKKLEKFKEPILALHAAKVSAEKIAKIINDSESGHRFATDTLRKFIAEHTRKPVQSVPAPVVVPKPAPAPMVAAPLAPQVLAAGVKK